MPKPGEAALSLRQRQMLREAGEALRQAEGERDLLCLADSLRQARLAFDRLVGRSSTDVVLDALFGRFCIGK
jgi:tRNA modification GTPase